MNAIEAQKRLLDLHAIYFYLPSPLSQSYYQYCFNIQRCSPIEFLVQKFKLNPSSYWHQEYLSLRNLIR
jgi:hypothetical protein